MNEKLFFRGNYRQSLSWRAWVTRRDLPTLDGHQNERTDLESSYTEPMSTTQARGGTISVTLEIALCLQTGVAVRFHPTPVRAVRHHLPPMEPPTKKIFLVIYSSRLFPSHWGVFVPSSEGSDAGVLINVIGDPSVGF